MIGDQVSDSQAQPSMFRVRLDGWGFLRALILLFSSIIGIAALYSVWAWFLG